MAAEPVLEVRHLNSYYSLGRSLFGGKRPRKQVLHDVSLEVGENEIISLRQDHPLPDHFGDAPGL